MWIFGILFVTQFLGDIFGYIWEILYFVSWCFRISSNYLLIIDSCLFFIKLMNNFGFILFVGLLTLAYQISCDPPSSTDQIFTGNLQIYNFQSLKNIRQYTVSLFRYEIKQPLSENQICLSSQSIQDYKPKGQLNYTLSGSYLIWRNSLQISLQTKQKEQWSTMQISYLVTQSDSVLIQKTPLNFTFLNPFQNSVPLVSDKIQQTKKYNVSIFISGIITNGSEFSINLYKANVTIENRTITFFVEAYQILLSNAQFVMYQNDNPAYLIGTDILTSTYIFEGPRIINNKQIITSRILICKAKTRCNQNQVLVNGQCKCVNSFVSIRNLCRKICAENAYLNDNNQCICYDGYNQIQGICKQCEMGQYFDKISEDCLVCPRYCMKCQNSFECDQCAIGFTLFEEDFFGLKTSSCSSECGDAKKAQDQECDDGNMQDGDGCSAECKLQKGWSCYGGSFNSISKCSPYSAQRTYIEIGRSVSLSNRTVVQFYLSSIPQCFKDNCKQNCPILFDVQVLTSDINLTPKIEYFGDHRFFLNFEYGGNRLLNSFTYKLKFNDNLPEEYKDCLVEEDLLPVFIRTIDPANV